MRSSPAESRELHKLNLCEVCSIISIFLITLSAPARHVCCVSTFLALITKNSLIDFCKLTGEGEEADAKSKKIQQQQKPQRSKIRKHDDQVAL